MSSAPTMVPSTLVDTEAADAADASPTPTFHASPRTGEQPSNPSSSSSSSSSSDASASATAVAPAPLPSHINNRPIHMLSRSPPASVRTLGLIVKSGILTKLGGNILNKWKTRWFVLTEESFTYFPSEADYLSGGRPPLGRMSVNGDLRCWSAGSSDLEWKFLSSEKTVVVRSTLSEKKDWYDAVDELVSRWVEKESKLTGKTIKRGGGGNSNEGGGNSGRPPSPSITRTGGGSSSMGSAAGSYLENSEMGDEVGEMLLFSSASRENEGGGGFDGGRGRSNTRGSSTDTGPETPTSSNSSSSIDLLSPTSSNSASSSSSAPAAARGSASVNRSRNNAGSNAITSTSASASPAASSSSSSSLSLSELNARYTKRASKSRKCAELFGWSPSQQVIKDFSCAIEKGIMLHGRMFLTPSFVGFYSNIFNEVKVVIPVGEILSVCQVNQAIIFPNAIKIFVKNSASLAQAMATAAAASSPTSSSSSSASSSSDSITEPTSPLERSSTAKPTGKAAKLLGLDKHNSASTSSLPSAASSSSFSSSSSSASQQQAESSYFFGSFAPGGRSKAFTLITQLLDGSFNADEYHMNHVFTPEPSKEEIAKLKASSASAAAAAAGTSKEGNSGSRMVRTESAESTGSSSFDPDDLEEDAEDAASIEEEEGGDAFDEEAALDAAMGGRPPGLDRMKSHLDFGAHRPSHAQSMDGDGGEIESKEMLTEFFPSINAKTLWRLFLSDAALFSQEHFHSSQDKHTEYAASSWKDARLVEGAALQGWQLVRDTMVRVPVIGSPMGPDSTRVLKVQKQKCELQTAAASSSGSPVNLHTISMETVAVTPDVPFGDSFFLQDSWTITDQPATANGAPGGCKLTINLGIKIHKMSWKLRAIKGMLISRALGDNQKGFIALVGEMKKWMAAHGKEVEAVRKVVMNNSSSAASRGSKIASNTPTKGDSAKVAPATPLKSPPKADKAAAASATPAAAAAAAAPSPSSSSSTPAPSTASFGALAPLVAKLPPKFQTVPIVAGLGAAFVLVLLFLLLGAMGLFSSSSSAAAAVAGIPSSTRSPSSSSSSAPSSGSYSSSDEPTQENYPPSHADAAAAASGGGGDGGTSWFVIFSLTVLLGGVGALVFKVQQLELEVSRLKANAAAAAAKK